MLLFGHVLLELNLKLLQIISQTAGHRRVITMHSFNFTCHLNEFWQLLAMNLVVALQYVINQLGGVGDRLRALPLFLEVFQDLEQGFGVNGA